MPSSTFMEIRFLCRQIKKRKFLYIIVLLFVMSSFILFYEQAKEEFLNQMEDPNLLTYDDPRLIKIISGQYLHPPSRKKYVLYNSTVKDPSQFQASEIRKLLNNKTNGFFVESGAFEGEYFSNSLFFEKFMKWQGLLIEPDPFHFGKLSKKNRKCWTAKACLSPDLSSRKLQFSRNGWGGAILKYSMQEEKNEFYSVQCFPLYSFLLAMNVTKVDYLSLDVEAVEFEVLKTIPWDKVNITTISVEHQFLDSEKKKELLLYMKNLGYEVVTDYIQEYVYYRIDYIFYHPGLLST